jgi:hypothetical protein
VGTNFFALAPGPHPRRELSLMPRGGPRGMAAGAMLSAHSQAISSRPIGAPML